MAEITQPSTTGKKRNTKCNKHSTRVDLTPMVDLGFLLITFFIFTTTLSDPKAMFLPLPDDKDMHDPVTASEEKTLQLVLESPDRIRYFYGTDSAHAMTTDYAASGVRKVILDKMAQVAQKYKKQGEMIVLIRPTEGAVYGNLVDVLDEMLINNVKKYILLD
jgi:biopolymer transport protein ExbD